MSETGGQLPNFFIIGAMKSGTTTLHEYLMLHPEVFMSCPKEPQFFSGGKGAAKGIEWYKSLFEGAKPGQVRGEASTCYSRWPHFGDVARKIAEVVPDPKVIYLMRDPVARSISHYAHIMEERLMANEAILSPTEALAAHPEILDASMYLTQIEKYLACFDRDRFLFLTLEDLKTSSEVTLNRVQEFLGVSRFPVGRKPILANEGRGTRFARDRIQNTLRRLRQSRVLKSIINSAPPSWRSQCYKFVLSRMQNSLVGRILERRYLKTIPIWPEALKDALRLKLEPEIFRLESFLGRDLSAWKRK